MAGRLRDVSPVLVAALFLVECTTAIAHVGHDAHPECGFDRAEASRLAGVPGDAVGAVAVSSLLPAPVCREWLDPRGGPGTPVPVSWVARPAPRAPPSLTHVLT